MIKSKAKVIYADKAQAQVVAQKKSTCGGCEDQTGCGISTLGKVFGNKTSKIDVDNQLNAKVGDEVEIGLSEKDLLKVALKSYIAPLAGFFIFAVIGTFLQNKMSFDSEWIVVLFAILGMGLGWKLFKPADVTNSVVMLKAADKQIVKMDS